MNSSYSRRTFLKTAAAGGATLAFSARSYAKIVGANERISIGQIGCGSRGVGAHMAGIHKHDKSQNVQFTAVCDPWRLARENAADKIKDWYGIKARQFSSYRDLLALKDIDAVMIASCDHQHTTHLKAAAEAGKDVYCEKPLARRMDRLKAACDAVKKAGVIVQIGTQLRSWPSFTGCRKVFQTGIMGRVSRIEQRRNYVQPYWYHYVKDVKKEDVDWKEFLMDVPYSPFDPVKYSGWYGYREFSDGPVPGFASHFIDLINYITGSRFPTSSVCMGGTFTWNDEHKFTCPDQVQALWTYPEGFMVSYLSNLGNSSDSTIKIFSEAGVMDLTKWSEPFLTADGHLPKKLSIRGKKPIEDVPIPDHFLNWLQCLRDRKTPNASIDAGYQHAVACIMAVQSCDTGKRLVYDPDKREIHPG